MQIRFNKDCCKLRVWVEIPGVSVGKENLKIEISQCTGSEINTITTSAYTKIHGKSGVTQYLDNNRLVANVVDMVSSHVHGWNLIDDKEKPVECTKENVKIFLDNYGNVEIEVKEKMNDKIITEINTTTTLKAFIGDKIQDPAFFLSGEQKN